MSHHSDDNMLIATSDSFWEPGNYKRTTRRIEDGHKLCDSLIALVQERAEIEKSYAKALKNWSKNWNDKIEKGPEYGTTEAAWKGVLVESDRLCDLHLRVKENLCNDIVQQVKTWQKDAYHKVRAVAVLHLITYKAVLIWGSKTRTKLVLPSNREKLTASSAIFTFLDVICGNNTDGRTRLIDFHLEFNSEFN